MRLITIRTNIFGSVPNARVATVACLVIFAVVAVVGCATTPAATPAYRRVGAMPEMNQVSSADVGSTIYAEFDYIEKTGATLMEGYDTGYVLGRVVVTPQEFLEVRGDQFCTITNAYHDPLTGPFQIVCFRDSNKDGEFDEIRVPNILMGKWRDLEHPLPYRSSNAVGEATGTKLELIYQGRAGDVIKVAYREYINNLVRPAFQQEVQYTLNSTGEPTEISFKGARITVLEASNNQIVYKVTGGFQSF